MPLKITFLQRVFKNVEECLKNEAKQQDVNLLEAKFPPQKNPIKKKKDGKV